MSFLGMEDWYNRMVVCRLWWRPGLRPLERAAGHGGAGGVEAEEVIGWVCVGGGV